MAGTFTFPIAGGCDVLDANGWLIPGASIGASTGPTEAASFASQILGMAHDFLYFAGGFSFQLDHLSTPNEGLPDLHIPSITSVHLGEGQALSLVEELLATRPLPPGIATYVPGETEAPPTLYDPGDIPEITTPEFTAVKPTTDFSGAPTAATYDTPVAPTVNSVGVPDAPNYPIPVSSELASISVPAEVALDIPEFLEELEDPEIPIPDASLNFNEQMYLSRLSTAVKALLTNDLVVGGYGLNVTDEEREFYTERDKASKEFIAATRQSVVKLGTSGFVAPTGAMNAALFEALGKTMDTLGEVDNALVAKRYALYTERQKFARDEAIRFEKMFSEFHSAMMARALEAAIVVGQIGVSVANAVIARYNLKADRFRELAKVYSAKVNAEIARVDSYRASVTAAGLLNETNAAIVSQYGAEVQYVGALARAYKAEVDKNSVLLEIEKLRTEIYQAQVEAYSAQVQVNKIVYDIYVATIDGELGKVEAYKAEAQAYASIVTGKKALIENKTLELEKATSIHRDRIALFDTEAKYNQAVRKAYLSAHQSTAEMLSAEASSYKESAGATIEAYKSTQSYLARVYDDNLAELKATAKTATYQMNRLASISKTSMAIASARTGVYAALAASGMSSANLNTTIGAGDSVSFSNSESESVSKSLSDSIAEVETIAKTSSVSKSTVRSSIESVGTTVSKAFREINTYGASSDVNYNYVENNMVTAGLEPPDNGTGTWPQPPAVSGSHSLEPNNTRCADVAISHP